MENNNSDWMAVQTQVGDASFADIYNLGVDPSSVTLDTKSSYKGLKKIKENPAFQSNGKFDDKKFDDFYDMSVKTLNAYKSSDFSVGTGNIPDMNLWEDTSLAKTLKQKTYKDPFSTKINQDPSTTLKLAQKSNLGFVDLNQWSDPQKSIAEVAQGQKVLDGSTGKELNFTAEDNGGIFNAFGFFDQPLVLSAYDEDVTDKDGKVIHQREETKFDERGLPRYETLAGRNASGKQVLSRFDTLTKEDSYINKFDYMDSDGLDKSIAGTIAKTATSLIPLALGGPIATAFKAYYIADGLLQAGTEIGKALSGIIGGPNADKTDFYKTLNNVQTFTKQWKAGTSENAKSNFITFENAMNLASDSVYQLMGQQGLSMWPQRIRQYQMAKELNLNPSLLEALTKGGDEATAGVLKWENYIAKYGAESGQAAIAMSKNIQALDNTAKYAAYGSRAFMAATSATGISDVGDQYGLDARDKGLLYLGYTAGLAPLFAANIGHWVEGGHEIDELSHGMNKALKNYASEYLTPVAKSGLQESQEAAAKLAKESLTGLAKLKDRSFDILKAGRDLGARVGKRFENINSPLMAALAEGTEEITEELLQDGVKVVYNGLSSLGYTSTKDKKIDFSVDDAMSRYGQAFVGGAVGGMIFKFVDPEVHTPTFISDNMKEYVANGFGDKVISQIKDMHTKGQLGATDLSINRHKDSNGVEDDSTWSPVNSDNPVSHNDFIADRMIKEVRANMAHLNNFGLTNPDAYTEGKNAFYDTLVDTRTDTDLRDQIKGASDSIVTLSNELKDIPENDINTEAIKKKKEEIKLAKERFEYLTTDESVDEYFRQGLFNINTGINSKFGVKTRQSFTEELIGSKNNYATLNDSDRAKVDTAFNDYRFSNNDSYGIRADLRNARLQMQSFDEDMKEHGGYEAIENYNESLSTLNDYVKAGKGVIDGKETEHTLLSLSEDFYNNMKDVKYIPDFLHDEINKRLTEIKHDGLERSINEVANKSGIPVDAQALRQSFIDSGITNLNESVASHGLLKAYLSKFKPVSVFDSPSYTNNLKDNKQANLSSMIKALSEVDGIEDNSEEKNLYDMRRDLINSLTPEQAHKLLVTAPSDLQYDQNIQDHFNDEYGEAINLPSDIEGNTKGEIYNMLNDVDYEGILDFDEDKSIPDGATAQRILHNINQQQFLSKATGQSTNYDLVGLNQSSNIFIDHALDGVLNNVSVGLNIDQYKKIDEQVDDIINRITDAVKDKATSPLATFLADTYRFKSDEFEKVIKNGVSNYVNNSDDFTQTLNDHIDKTKKVSAYLEGLFKLNPVINEWRKNNQDIVPKELRDEELTTITPLGYGTIFQNSNILLNELSYLKDLNDFNKNNTLAKLLKEDGKQLSSSFKTLQKLQSIPELTENLPSLNAFLNDPLVSEYVGDIEAGTDEQKIAALGVSANYEHKIYNEFQSLNPELKQSLIDLVFKPINSSSYTFRSNVDADAPLNDMHQTLYMAKIFGSSSLEYNKAIAGEKTPEGYSKITEAKMDPFPAQESAIRLAYLSRYGDPQVYQSLTTAFAYKNEENPPSTFRRDNAYGIDVSNILTVVGDPGVGKTKAIMAGILSFDEDIKGDTVLLGSVNEHVENLSQGIINAGFESRINAELTSNIKDFITELNLTDSDNKLLTIDTDSPDLLTKLSSLQSYTPSYTDDQKVATLLNNTTNSVMHSAKLTENDGKFNEILAKKFKGVRNIIIDEFTHSNPIDLAIITNVVNAYNKSVNNDKDLKITITLAGDNNQLGFSIGNVSRTFADFIAVPTSVPLTTSLRSGWDVVNNTLIEVKDRTSQLNDMTNQLVADPVTASRLQQIPIKLNYTVTDGNPIGIYREVASGDTTSDHLRFFKENVDTIKSSEKSLIYVVQNTEAVSSAEALLRDMLGSDWSKYASVLTAKNTQGREYKYAIIDAEPDSTKDDIYKVRKGYKFLNTMLSRATEATLLIDKGAYDTFVSWSQLEVPKAIDQKKLTDDMIGKIKENRQAIITAILDNPIETNTANRDDTKEAPVNSDDINQVEDQISTQESVTDTPPKDVENVTAPETDEDTNKQPNIPVEILPVFNEVDEQALLGDNNDISGSPQINESSDDFARTSPYMVNAYTSFTYKRDTDQVKALLETPGMSDLDAEGTLMNLKEWVTYKDFSVNYFNSSIIMNKLREKGYTSKNTSVRISVLKRDNNFIAVGRSNWNSDYTPKIGEDLLVVEGIIKNKLGKEPFVFTIGTFNSLENIQKYGGDTEGVKTFLSGVRSALASKQSWSSPEFTLQEWKNFTTIRQFKVNFKEGGNIAFSDLKSNYNRNLTITEPQVIIAKNNNTSLERWQANAGKSVSFVTEHEALRGKSPEELYKIYANQVAYYNNDAYNQMSYEQKEAYIKGLPKIPGTNISPSPKLVQLINLNNPKYEFTQFITNYNSFQAKLAESKANGSKLNTQTEVREFEMSPYVSDRLVKSMMLVHRMLTDENSTQNRQWFEQNVMPNIKGNVLNDISSYMQQTRAEALANGDDFNFGTLTAADFVSNETDSTALHTIDDLVSHLDNYLYGDSNLIRGVYKTNEKTANQIKGVDLTPNVDLRSILPEQLTTDKSKDFSVNGILNVKNFAIYSKLKPSFLKIMNESFKALGSIPAEEDLGKYSLTHVFKDGLIENIIVAGVGTNGRNINNVIAPVVKTSLSSGFKTNVANISSASFFVDFDAMMNKVGQIADSSIDANTRQVQEDTERITTDREFKANLENIKLNSDYDIYDQLATKSFANKAELDQFIQNGIQANLKPDIIVSDINKAYSIDTLNGNKTFNDVNKEGVISSDLHDNGNLVTVTSDYEDRVETTTFDKKNGFNQITSTIFKNQEGFNPTDEARKFIDSNALTKEDVIKATSEQIPTDLAWDLTPLKNQSIIINNSEGVPSNYKLLGSSIGETGSIYDSYVSVQGEDGSKYNTLMANLPEDITKNLEIHPRSEQKAKAYYSLSENHDYTSTVYDMVNSANPEMEEETKDSVVSSVLEQLGLKDGDGEIRDDRSIYKQMMQSINEPKTLIVNPFINQTPESDILIDAYNKLAEALYSDNLHNANGFLNNFSIFANGEWEQYQNIIDQIAINADPELAKNIIKLEEQLNKLTHDC